MPTIDEKIELKLKQDKIDLIKGIAAGKIAPDVARYLIELLKKKDRVIWLVYYNPIDSQEAELLPEYKKIKALHDKIPQKYKYMFYTVEVHEQDLNIGRRIE